MELCSLTVFPKEEPSQILLGSQPADHNTPFSPQGCPWSPSVGWAAPLSRWYQQAKAIHCCTFGPTAIPQPAAQVGGRSGTRAYSKHQHMTHTEQPISSRLCLVSDPAPSWDVSRYLLYPEVRWQKLPFASLQRILLLTLIQSRGKKEGGLCVQAYFCLDNVYFCICLWLTRTHWSPFLLWLRSQKLSATQAVTKPHSRLSTTATLSLSGLNSFASHERKAWKFFCPKNWDLCKGRDCCPVFLLSTDYCH